MPSFKSKGLPSKCLWVSRLVLAPGICTQRASVMPVSKALAREIVCMALLVWSRAMILALRSETPKRSVSSLRMYSISRPFLTACMMIVCTWSKYMVCMLFMRFTFSAMVACKISFSCRVILKSTVKPSSFKMDFRETAAPFSARIANFFITKNTLLLKNSHYN